MEVVIASSPTDAGISCWDVQTGGERLRYRSCASPPHGLISVGQRFLASSQIREPRSSSGSVLYWSWNKPQVEVKSFPSEPIKPLLANREGTYIIGGGSSGYIYLWEVPSGKLLKKWHGHYRGATCLAFSDDESLLISGAEDGCVRVWSLIMIFDDIRREEAKHLFEYSFNEHTLCVTDVACGYGGCNAIIVSASEDRTCKVWSLAKGRLLRNIVFPSIIDAIALDPGERVFYAGSRDGKIYIAALNTESTSKCDYGMHIIGSLFDHSKAVSCLTLSKDGRVLFSGCEDGLIRVWDTEAHNITRILRHAKGPVNNILAVEQPFFVNHGKSISSQASLKRHKSLLPPPLEKYVDQTEDNCHSKVIIDSQATDARTMDALYFTVPMIDTLIRELQQHGSSAATEMEIERLKLDCRKSMHMIQQWKSMHDNLQQFCLNELLAGDQAGTLDGDST